MKVVVYVRVLNEEKNIEHFVMSYQNIADVIIVADGGSDDRTREIAQDLPKVELHNYDQRRLMENGHWRNPQADHLNFMVWKAMEHNPDWILGDDCDCWPNRNVKANLRQMLKHNPHPWVYAVRLYTWFDDQHFPNMAKPGPGNRDWAAGLYGWNPHKVRPIFLDTKMAFTWYPNEQDFSKILQLRPPFCLLHNWQIDRERKLEKYDKSGQIPGIKHPLEMAGPLRPLPEWAYE